MKVFHIHEVREGQQYGAKYITIPHEELEQVSTGPILFGTHTANRVHVVTRLGVDGAFLDFNPHSPILESHTVWIVDPIRDFQIDLAKW
jgi:hypothetical protein